MLGPVVFSWACLSGLKRFEGEASAPKRQSSGDDYLEPEGGRNKASGVITRGLNVTFLREKMNLRTMRPDYYFWKINSSTPRTGILFM